MSVVTNAINQANTEFNQALSKQKGSALDKDSFMLLLVSQFKYQDPLNPMDDKEFIAQMAQFSSLEQMMNMNESMQALTEATNNQQMFNATGYIGKLVSVAGNTIGKVTDGATGDVTISTFRYAFGDNVVKGTLTVRDASGNTVYTEDLAGKQAGTTFEFNWSGLNGAGEVMDDGVYSISLAAFNSKGEAVLSDQVVDATVTGIVNSDGQIMLGMDGGQLMSMANIRQVTTPKPKKVEANPPKDEEEGEGSGGEGGEGSEGSGGTEGSGGAGDAPSVDDGQGGDSTPGDNTPGDGGTGGNDNPGDVADGGGAAGDNEPAA